MPFNVRMTNGPLIGGRTALQGSPTGDDHRRNRRLNSREVTVMVKLIIAMMMVLASLLAPSPATAQDAGVACGPDDAGYYRCGAILVILTEETADTIEDVIQRMGGDPAADILQEFSAVRDLLDPDGVVEDTSAATVYQIAVPVGQEHAVADAYRADPAVYGAAVDRETIGSTTPPNTALLDHGVAGWWTILLGCVFLLAAVVLARSLSGRERPRRLA